MCQHLAAVKAARYPPIAKHAYVLSTKGVHDTIMQRKPLKIGILSLFLFNVAYGAAISSALGDMSNAFPSASQSTVGLVVTLPALPMVFFGLLSGKLSTKISKRKLLIVGWILFLIGGVGGGMYENLSFILVMRFILGIGFGIASPIAQGLVVEFYKGREQATMMGLSNAVTSIGSMVSMLIGGFLCTLNWRYAFLVYLIALIPLLFAIFNLTDPPVVTTQEENQEISLINKQVVGYSLMAAILMMFVFSYFSNISIFIANEKLGSAASSGVVASISQCASLVSAAAFSVITQFFKRFTYSVTLALMGIGFLFLSFASNLNSVIIGSLFYGSAMGLLIPTWLLAIANLASPGRHVFAFSFLGAFLYFGQFASSLFLPFVGMLLKNPSIRFSYLLSAVFLLGVGLILAVNALRPQKQAITQ